MKRKQSILSHFFALFTAVSVLVSLLTVTALGAEPQTPLTPDEAAAEMTWGVNFPDFFIADVTYHNGFPIGYCENAPYGLGIWFWNQNYDWLAFNQIHEDVYSVSVTLPTYYSGTEADWIGGLFTIAVMTTTPDQPVTFSFSDTKLTTTTGQVTALSTMNKTYETVTNGAPNGNGYYSCFLDIDKSQLPQADSQWDGATFSTTVTLISAPFASPEAKADCFFEFSRIQTDPYEMIDLFLAQGANVVRLPVTWTSFVNDTTYEIDQAWLQKVQEIVDYILSKGAYCILNTHNDYLQRSYVDGQWHQDWMFDTYQEKVDERFAAIWQQIADYFKDYPDRLIFEPCNEPTMDWYEGAPANHFDTQVNRVNELNELFVNTVRATGGNNDTRLLCLAVANYNHYGQLSRLELPENDDYLMVQIHSYSAMEKDPNMGFDPYFDYVTETNNLFAAVDAFTQQTGVPVIVGELGITHRESDAVQAPKVQYFFEQAAERNVPCLWWEDSFDNANYYYWLYNKQAGEWGRPEILQAIQSALDLVPVTVRVNGADYAFAAPLEGAATVLAAAYDSSGQMAGCVSASRTAGQTSVTLALPLSQTPAEVRVFCLEDGTWRPLIKALP